MKKSNSLLSLRSVSKFYYNGGKVSTGFIKVNLDFNIGEFVVITGESGSGKSTLLNVISGLDSYEEGEMYINGEETSHYSESDFEDYRKSYIGNIFQSFNLINSYTVYQNIELVLLLNGYKKENIHDKIIDLIKTVDLYKFRNTKVSKLSGGQKQRVSIARSLAKDTPIIVADEPTGNLDSKNARSIMKLLSDIAKNKLVIVVTHNYEQVEEYATRKIEMHDGKVLEDILLKENSIKSEEVKKYGNIKFFSLLKLGFRNTFNILSKFVLTYGVFLFLILAFMLVYGLFNSADRELNNDNYNSYFLNNNKKRIVINKNNKDGFNDDDYNYIKSILGVDYFVKNDVVLDSYYYLASDYNYFNVLVNSYDNIKNVDKGRLPENSNEIILEVYGENYLDDTLTGDDVFSLSDDYGSLINDNMKIVGYIFNSSSYNGDTIYISSETLDKISKFRLINYFDKKIIFNNNVVLDSKEMYLNINVLENLEEGKIILPSEYNNYCDYGYCPKKKITLNSSGIYFNESLSLEVIDTYNKDNYTKLTDLKSYDYFDNQVYISLKDYEKLFNKGVYQVSVFAINENNINDINKSLIENGYKTLVLKDSLYNNNALVKAIIKIFRFVVMIASFVVLFFICYFVIKLIQKSKNIYYSTVRILGASKKVVDRLIKLELVITYNLAFISTIIIFVIFNSSNSKNGFILFIKDLVSLLNNNDYILIYIICLIISYLIANRYARNLFKKSAMKTYREEV